MSTKSKGGAAVRQYEPLQVPSKWGDEERRLVRRLGELFDDIYRRWGRLEAEDLSDKLNAAMAELRQSAEAASVRAEQAERSASESFAAANNASREAYAAKEGRYRVGDCLLSVSAENPAGRHPGGWVLLGSGTLLGAAGVYLWKRVS